MKITYIGHACFKLETAGAALVLDPYADGSVPGITPVRETADAVLCSHGHGDHGCKENVTLTGKALEDTPFKVDWIDTWHDDVQGAKRGPNRIHIVHADGFKIVHLGDLGCELTDEQLDQLCGADCLMVPVGGFFTIDGHQAAAIAARIGAGVTIPMHFRGEGFGYDVISEVDDFTGHFVEENEGESSIELLGGTAGSRVVLLSPLNK